MLRLLLTILAFSLTSQCQADNICALVFDLDNETFLVNEGDCDQPISPASTFKIPLSLIGYDSGYLTNTDLPELPFRNDYPVSLPSHKHETSPKYWMKNSVVWYSQALTEWLGMKRFAHYIENFDYGNHDLSGDAGKNNGLTRAWLSSSLKITPVQQLSFLKSLINRELPVKEEAYEYTEQLLKQDINISNFDIYGKTGTVGLPVDKNGEKLENRQFGWFIGWAVKNDRKFIFVNIISEPKQEGIFSGAKAREEILSRLKQILPINL